MVVRRGVVFSNDRKGGGVYIGADAAQQQQQQQQHQRQQHQLHQQQHHQQQQQQQQQQCEGNIHMEVGEGLIEARGAVGRGASFWVV